MTLGSDYLAMSKLPFSPKIFFKVLAIIVVLLLTAFAIIHWIMGSMTTRDIVGSSISSVIFAYLVHLWLLPAGDHPHDGREK